MPGVPFARVRLCKMEGSIMNPERQRTREGVLFLVLFALTIPAANWLIGHVGTTCVPQGPCLVPVAPGLMAPSGVTMVGIALVLRDLVQRRLGTAISALAVLVGSGLSALYAPASLVVASATAFLLSELADLAVYTPLARRRLVAAVIASSCSGLTRMSKATPAAAGAAVDPACGLAASPRQTPRYYASMSAIGD